MLIEIVIIAFILYANYRIKYSRQILNVKKGL